MIGVSAHRHPKQCWLELRQRELRGERIKTIYAKWWRVALGYHEDVSIDQVRAELAAQATEQQRYR